jgi:hemoglobin
MVKPDIQNSADIEKLIQHFYINKIIDDPIIGFLFTDIAQIDIKTHLPKVSGFWKKVLLQEKNAYQGKMFLSHKHLNNKVTLNKHHFIRWLYLFEQSVDEFFAGEVAELAKKRAHAVAESMLNGLRNPY